jgi:hypothetical protein
LLFVADHCTLANGVDESPLLFIADHCTLGISENVVTFSFSATGARCQMG